MMSGWAPPGEQGPGNDPHQPDYGQPQPEYGRQSGGHEQSPGQPQYGQAPYGQPPYGQPGPQQQPYGQAAYPPAKKSRTGLVIGLLVGAIALVAVIVVGVVFATGGSGKQYQIVATESAGGLNLLPDSVPESSPGSSKDKRQYQLEYGGTVDSGVFTTYADGGTDLVFGGVNGKFRDPDKLVSRLRSASLLPGVSVWKDIDPGPHGGKAACGENATDPTISFCAWQTSSTFGEIMAMPSPETLRKDLSPKSVSVTELADSMRRMRLDLELEK
jgi:hypothetical protein